jgi:hypothetical protein
MLQRLIYIDNIACAEDFVYTEVDIVRNGGERKYGT